MSDHPSMPCRRRLIGLALAAVLAPRLAFSSPPPTLRIGLMPYLPTDRLIATHQGLRRFFESSFGRPAALTVGPDAARFLQRTLAGEYDLILSGPPAAWAGYRTGVTVPIAVSTRPLIFYVVVRKDSPIQSLADLRGKTVGSRPPETFAPRVFAEMLRPHGLKAGVDVNLRFDNVPYNYLMSLKHGKLDAAIYPSISLPSLPADLLAGLRNIAVSPAFPSIMFSARRAPELPSPEALQAALLRFVRETPEGAQYLRDLDLEDLRPPDLKALKFLDRYIDHAR